MDDELEPYRQLPVPVRLDQVSTLQDTSLSWYPARNWIAGIGDGGAIGGLDEAGDGD